MQKLAPLRIPAFRRLIAVYAINRLGDIVALVAMAIVVWDKTHSVWATTGLFAALEFVPDSDLMPVSALVRLSGVPCVVLV